MAELATPVSDLFKNNTAKKGIIAASFCLECREETMMDESPKQYIFHFDRSILHPWRKKEKDFINSAVSLKKELKLVSFHMAASCSEPVLKDNIFYCGGREFSWQEMLDNAQSNIRWMKSCIRNRNIKIAVENNNYYPTPAYRHITDSDFISQVVKKNRIFFLFDMAHAKITEYNKKTSYKKYTDGLPLDKIIQIHISREGFNGKGWACDMHELPDKSIFEETKEIILKHSPEYITIEYYKNWKKLIQVLKQYRQLCAGSPSSATADSGLLITQIKNTDYTD